MELSILPIAFAFLNRSGYTNDYRGVFSATYKLHRGNSKRVSVRSLCLVCKNASEKGDQR